MKRAGFASRAKPSDAAHTTPRTNARPRRARASDREGDVRGSAACYPTKMHRLLACTSIFLLAACSPKSADTDDPTGSSGPGTDGAEATSATGTPTTGDDPSPPQMSAGTAPDPSTSTSTGTSTTTAGTSATSTSTTTGDDTGDGGLPGACEAACKRWDMCEPGVVGPVDECIAACVGDTGDDPGCAAASAAHLECVAGQSCEEALAALKGTSTTCLAEAEAVDAACSQVTCGGEIGGDDSTCELEQQCGDVTQRYVCDVEVCTCKQEGAPDKQCPADGFCMLDSNEQRAAIEACCGWEWDILGA